MNDLREITSYPSFLEKAGFVEKEEHTTDVVRWVWFEKTIDAVESQVRLVVQVEFELSISDAPFVRTRDNFSYYFNGVYLKVIDRQMERLDEETELPREIDRIKINVSTRSQLRSLCKMLK